MEDYGIKAILCGHCGAYVREGTQDVYADCHPCPSPMRPDGGTDPFLALEDAWWNPVLKKMVDAMPETLADMCVPGRRVLGTDICPVTVEARSSVVKLGGLATMGPPPDPTTKAASPSDVLREREDRAQELLDSTPESTLLIMYKLLYARGVRITTIDHDIKQAIGREET